ncbi:hypothetical protein D3C76_1277610 [compost metagenome]
MDRACTGIARNPVLDGISTCILHIYVIIQPIPDMDPADVKPAARIRGRLRLDAVHGAVALRFDLARNRGWRGRRSAINFHFGELARRPDGIGRNLDPHVSGAGGRKVDRHRIRGARIKRIAGRGLQIGKAGSVRASLDR